MSHHELDRFAVCHFIGGNEETVWAETLDGRAVSVGHYEDLKQLHSTDPNIQIVDLDGLVLRPAFCRKIVYDGASDRLDPDWC